MADVTVYWVMDEHNNHPARLVPANISLWAPLTPEYRGHPRQSHLNHAGHSNPDEVRDCLGRPRVSKAQVLSGKGMLPEAKAGSRKARGNHNLPDRSNGQPERAQTGSRCFTQRTW